MGNRGVWLGWREPFRSTAFETVSDAAAPGEIWRSDFRTRRPEARLASVPIADGDSFPAPTRAQRLRTMRLLRKFRLRSWRQVQHPGDGHSNGGENGTL